MYHYDFWQIIISVLKCFICMLYFSDLWLSLLKCDFVDAWIYFCVYTLYTLVCDIINFGFVLTYSFHGS